MNSAEKESFSRHKTDIAYADRPASYNCRWKVRGFGKTAFILPWKRVKIKIFDRKADRLSKKPFQPENSEGRIVGKGTVRVPFPLNQQHFNAVKMFAACQKSGKTTFLTS